MNLEFPLKATMAEPGKQSLAITATTHGPTLTAAATATLEHKPIY